MPTIDLALDVRAPRERCFDLARSVDVHTVSAGATREAAIAGRTAGLISLGEEVTWRARHLGRWHTMTNRITALERPVHFRDEMVRGPFAWIVHDHRFLDLGNGTTRMEESFRYAAPYGLLGRAVERIVLTRHLRRFLEERNRVIRDLAEGEGWRRYLP